LAKGCLNLALQQQLFFMRVAECYARLMDYVIRRQDGASCIGRLLGALLPGLAFGLMIGCASPGPPKAPSLNLPQPVNNLTAQRSGDIVELHFTAPHISTDKLPLFDPRHHHTMIKGVICRETTPRHCDRIGELPVQLTAADGVTLSFRDILPNELACGEPRLLAYRVEFFSDRNRSAGKSEPAFTAAGKAPEPIADLRAGGTRAGALLEWTPSPAAAGDVLLHRVSLQPKPAVSKAAQTEKKAAPKSVVPKTSDEADLWLKANAKSQTLDTTVSADEPYRYTAVRRVSLTLDSHAVELHSAPSSTVEFALKPVYAPAAPAGLDASSFQPPTAQGAEPQHFAVDLIWQPVSDAAVTPSLASLLVGYIVYREALTPAGTRIRLTATPTPEPSFHDASAEAAVRYRYSVTAVDGNGNESKAASVVVDPQAQ
jgi:hypothetical protein